MTAPNLFEDEDMIFLAFYTTCNDLNPLDVFLTGIVLLVYINKMFLPIKILEIYKSIKWMFSIFYMLILQFCVI